MHPEKRIHAERNAHGEGGRVTKVKRKGVRARSHTNQDAHSHVIVPSHLRRFDSTAGHPPISLPLKIKHFLPLFGKKTYLSLPKLLLSGGDTASPLRCRCRRSSWSIAR